MTPTLLLVLLSGCETDMECKGNRVCQAGVCIAPEDAGAAEPSPSVDSNVNLHVNALGLLQFGLAPTLEVGGEHFSVLARARFYNTGLLSYFVIGNPDSEEVLKFSIGAGLGVRGWALGDGNMRGLYYGAALEWASVRADDEEDDLASYRRQIFIAAGDVGYRWVFGSFLLGVGLNAGVGVPVAAKDVPIGSDGCAYADSCLEEKRTTPFGMLVLDLGGFL